MITRPRPIIAVDMDEVIADALAEHLLRYNRDFPPSPGDAPLTNDDLHGRWLWDAVPPSRLKDLERYMLSEDFFRVLPVMPDAQRVLERLQSRYDIFIASAAMEVPSSFTPKYHWLAEHFPFIPTGNIVFCGSKSIIHANFLIDDNPRQLRLFQGDIPPKNSVISTEAKRSGETPVSGATTEPFTREGILFTSPANVNITGFRRVNNWLDVESLFLP